MQNRTRTATSPSIDLPPPFRLVTLREVGDAFVHAKTIAAELGAGTLVHVGRFDLVEFAVVLEPEEPLRTARRAFYAGMVALRDALLAHAPPERPITFTWPDAIQVDGGLIGGGRLAWPAGSVEAETPGVAGVRRHASVPLRWASRRPACARWPPHLPKKASTISDPAGWSKASHAISCSPSMAGRPTASPRWREDTSITSRSRKAAMAALDDNGDLLVRWRGQKEPDRHDPCRSACGAVVARPSNGRAALVKLLRTIRLDPSDTFVFERAAEPGEWAVPGAFAFAHADLTAVEGKSASGVSLWFSRHRFARLVYARAGRRGERGRPRSSGRAAGACGWLSTSVHPILQPPGLRPKRRSRLRPPSAITPRACWLQSRASIEDGAIRETFRTLTPGVGLQPARAYAFLEVAGEDDAPEEHVDLLTLGNGEPQLSGPRDFWLSCGHHLARSRCGRRAARDR